jgi:DNA/RNA-binding domain of Phe-tRNA-synthetase-like protein
VTEESRLWLDGALVDPEVLVLRPDYRALLITADGLRPGPSDAASDALLVDAESGAAALLAGRAPEELVQVRQWREAYRAFGAKPQRTRPSVEALLRRLEDGIPRIDRITDAYNAVSIAHLLPIGGEDLAAYHGPARLVRANGDEDFDTVSEGEASIDHPETGEVVWRDDLGVTCRRWNWRQCRRTRITESTQRAVFILDGLAALGENGLADAGEDLVAALRALSPEARFERRLVVATDQGI